jgi:hypothetical protein
VLLREDEQALALLDRLLADGELTQDDIATWPLFDRLRATGEMPGQATGLPPSGATGS